MHSITQPMASTARTRGAFWRRLAASVAIGSLFALPAFAQTPASVSIDYSVLEQAAANRGAALLVPPPGVKPAQRVVLKPPSGTPRYVPGKIKPIKLSLVSPSGAVLDNTCACPPARPVARKRRAAAPAAKVTPASAVAPATKPAPTPAPAPAAVAPKAPAPAPATAVKPAPAAAPVPAPAPPPPVRAAVPTPAPAPATTPAAAPAAAPATPPKPPQQVAVAPAPQVLTPPARPATPPAAAPTPAPSPAPAAKPAEAPKAEPQVAAIPAAPRPSEPAKTEAPAADKPLTIVYTTGSQIPTDAATSLKDLTDRLAKDSSLRVQLMSYASDAEKNVSRSRRLSLERAVAVRKMLMDNGVDSTRIEVRALGDQNAGGAPDRVDIVISPRR